MAVDPLTAALEVGNSIINKIWPDAGEADRAKMQMAMTQFASQADIVKTEASSGNWLTSGWRPITMLTFTALIVARWFGWSAPNLEPQEYLKLWDIVQLGLGGYVIGRSGEKIAETVAGVLKK
jgi:hypothetical protein